MTKVRKIEMKEDVDAIAAYWLVDKAIDEVEDLTDSLNRDSVYYAVLWRVAERFWGEGSISKITINGKNDKGKKVRVVFV